MRLVHKLLPQHLILVTVLLNTPSERKEGLALQFNSLVLKLSVATILLVCILSQFLANIDKHCALEPPHSQ